MQRVRQIYHRRSVRLKGYNYAKAGQYYVTLNCIGREHIFGEIKNREMHLNDFGQIAFNEWKRTATLLMKKSGKETITIISSGINGHSTVSPTT